MLTIGSLFSGIGGLELGLEESGLGPVVWQVERDPFCRAVLARHWPNVERYLDVRDVGATNLARVDLICGGFPCQDVSSAGKGAGIRGERSGLWREFARIVGDMRPGWVVVENVTSGAKRWLDPVCRELGELGYAALPIPLSAQDVGAPHRRSRIFIVAHAHGVDDGCARHASNAHTKGKYAEPVYETLATQSEPHRKHTRAAPWDDPMPQPSICGMADGSTEWLHRYARIRALGNAVVPQCAEVVGWVIRELIDGIEALQKSPRP